MRMERLAVMMPRSTARVFRRYSQIHDVDLCVTAKTAVTRYCRMVPSRDELMDNRLVENEERVFISLPDTAMRLLEFWSKDTGIQKQKLMEWAIRQLANEQSDQEEEEQNEQ